MFLSIIIPVHNCEKFLNECLESCFDQDVPLDTYQVICIDDGSTDNSRYILSNYNKYENFLCFYQKQGGVSKARNLGLKMAQGEYVWFLDADDFIEKNFLQDVYTRLLSSKCDRLKVLSYCFIDELSYDERVRKERKNLQSNYPYKNTQITRTILKKAYIEKHNIQFYEELMYGEDTLFNYESRIYFPTDDSLDKIGYYYRKHKEASTSFNNILKIQQYFLSCNNALQIVSGYYNERVSMKITREMLIYWLNNFLYYGGQVPESVFSKGEINEKIIINVQWFDIKLINIYKIYKKVFESSQYNLLVNYHEKVKEKRLRRSRKLAAKKKIAGYMKHPKRLLQNLHWKEQNK